MELVKVKRNYQITIPQNLRRIIRLTVGDYVEVDIQDDTLVIRPVKVIHPDQEYFFTKEWQEKEAEAEQDIAEGKVVGPFKNRPQEIQEAIRGGREDRQGREPHPERTHPRSTPAVYCRKGTQTSATLRLEKSQRAWLKGGRRPALH